MSDNKPILDLGAAMLMIGSLASWLPNIAALITIVWYSLRIYDWCKGKCKS